MHNIQFRSVEDALGDIKKGQFVIIVDNENLVNEASLVMAAEYINAEKVNFIESQAKGLICVALSPLRCDDLELPMMVANNTSVRSTAFTVSVDLLISDTATGISSIDKAKTIKALTDFATKPNDLARPGHIFPIKAKEKGVLRRIGHTEAAYDLAKLAGLFPAGVVASIKNNNGEIADLKELAIFSKKHNIKIITIGSLVKYRLERESLIEKGVEVNMPTQYGDFRLIPFKQKSNGLEHVALIKGTWDRDEALLVRVHSSCVTGDIFGSKRCECGEQLHKSMEMIQKEGRGVVVYLNQEGRGIGLMAKMEAYKLQEEGYDTVDANLHLGFKADERNYGVGAAILREINVKKMRLLTNNPIKRVGLESFGLDVIENVPIEVGINKYNKFYMQTKKERMGHNLHDL